MSGPFRPEPAPRPANFPSLAAWAEALCNHIDATLQQLESLSQIRDIPSKMPYTVSNVTASRTFDATAATLAETRQFVGTLVEDLVTKRIVKTKGPS